MKIPWSLPNINKKDMQSIKKVLDSGWFSMGSEVKKFEEKTARHLDIKYAVAANTGTAALDMALKCLDIGEKDEVIIPALAYIATANVVLFCDANPVFCDVNPRTFNIDVEKIESLITKKTKAIMPVHLYGQPADMKLILEISEKHGLFVVGDAAQAHGARYDDEMVGSFGDIECFSFYATKNMTTGEGGMVTTNNIDIAESLFSLRNHGREKTKWGYEHGRLGYNFRMTDVAAAIGIEQLKKLPEFNKKRRKNAMYFNEKLVDIEVPYILENVEHVYHQYTIKSKDRATVIKCLRDNDIGFGIYYPKPLHFYSHLSKYSHNDLKNSEKISQEVLSLPVHPALSLEDLEKIVECF